MSPVMALHWKPKGMPDTPPRKVVDLPPQSPVTTQPRPAAPVAHRTSEPHARSSRSQRPIYGPPTPAVQPIHIRRDSSSTTRTDESSNLKSCLKQRKSSSGYNTDDPSTRSRTEQPVHVKLSSNSRKSGAPPPLAHGSSYMSGYSTSNESYASSRRSSASNDSHQRHRTSSQSHHAEQPHQHRMHNHTPPRQIYANTVPNTPYVPPSQPHAQHRRSEDPEARRARHEAEKIIVPLKEPEITLSWPLVKRNKSSGTRRMDHDEVLFDIGQDPSQIRLRHDPLTIQRPHRDTFKKIHASSHEAVEQMEIMLQGTIIDHLGFKIVVQRPGGIKCSDVFKDIYAFFNVRLSSLPPFTGLLPPNFDQLPLCKEQFRLRCDRTPGLAFIEQKCGLRVVDLLLGNTRFLGLTRDASRKVWVMELGTFEYR